MMVMLFEAKNEREVLGIFKEIKKEIEQLNSSYSKANIELVFYD